MTKRFTVTADVFTEDGWVEISENKTVTDRMEERNSWKATYAKQWFRKKYNLTGTHRITVIER